jgi:hypothetical protein
MPNASLQNSVRFNLQNSLIGIKTDDLFSTGPKANCYWMMDLGSSMHIKVVLIIGDYNNEPVTNGHFFYFADKPNTNDWYLTVGENSNPLQND